MKADLHIHTFYSKHACGTLEECVLAAIKKDIKILTFTDHAPFVIDQQNRLSEYELETYLQQINVLQKRYQHQIKILSGLEVDCIPESIDFVAKILRNHNFDFYIGAVHFLFDKKERINIWDIEKLSNEKIIVQYFENVKYIVSTGLFDAIGHLESILRGGMCFDTFLKNIEQVIPCLRKYKIAVEMNTSLPYKEVFECQTLKKIILPSLFYRSQYLKLIADNKIPITLGSDAHKPSDIGRDIAKIYSAVKSVNGTLVYFEKHSPKLLDIKNG